jgi:hypothetical protein
VRPVELLNWASRTAACVSSKDDGTADEEDADEARPRREKLGVDRRHRIPPPFLEAVPLAQPTPLKVWRVVP